MRIGRILAGLAVLVLALGAAAWLAGRAAAERLLVAAIEREGLGPVQLRVAGIGLDGLHLADVAFGPGGAIRATAVDVGLSIAGLRRRRADWITIEGLHLDVAVDAAGTVTIAGLGSGTAPSGNGPPDSGLPVLPAAMLVLVDARIGLAAPWGQGEARLSGRIAPTAAGLAAELLVAGDLGPVQVAGGTVTATVAAPDRGQLHLAGAAVTAPAVTATGVTADLTWQGEIARLAATSGAVTDRTTPARVAPVTAELHAQRHGRAIQASLTASAHKDAARLTMTGQADLVAGTATATLALTLARFAPGKLQPRDLVPALPAGLPAVTGTIGLAGTVAWKAGRLTPDLVVSADGLGIAAPAAHLADGRANIRIDSLAPPATPPHQHLIATLTAPGLAPMPLTLSFQLRPDGRVAVEALDAGFAGGRLSTGGLTLAPGQPLPADLALPLRIENVDLAPLLDLIGVEGLSGSGRLDGVLPLALAGGKPTLEAGQVTGRGPGVIRYTGQGLPADAGESVALLRDALKDFHYDSLAVDIEHDAAVLHLKGANPAVLDGRPFALNIRLDTDFAKLAALAEAALQAAGGIARGAVAPHP